MAQARHARERASMGTIDGLPPLREVIRAHDAWWRKSSWARNFLLDLNLTAKIARMAGDLSACDVLEVGPGPGGGLTRGLLAEGARRVLVVEKDPRCIPRWRRLPPRIRGGWRSCKAMRWNSMSRRA